MRRRRSRKPPWLRSRIFNGYFRVRGRLHRHPPKPVAAGPHPVAQWFLPWKIAKLLNLAFVEPSEAPGCSLGLWFELSTRNPVRRTDDRYFGTIPALNSDCGDISKHRVMTVFEEVFGYGYAVDPLRHEGRMVCKGNGNSFHDGEIVQGPISETEPDHVYQRLIDNRVTDDRIEDLRVCIIGEEIPFVFSKQRSATTQFDTVPSRCRLTHDALSPAERELLITFAGRFGLDLGELDVLRDRGDGRVYVVDVNNTPFSPPRTMLNFSGARCMHLAADSFRRQYLAGTS